MMSEEFYLLVWIQMAQQSCENDFVDNLATRESSQDEMGPDH